MILNDLEVVHSPIQILHSQSHVQSGLGSSKPPKKRCKMTTKLQSLQLPSNLQLHQVVLDLVINYKRQELYCNDPPCTQIQKEYYRGGLSSR